MNNGGPRRMMVGPGGPMGPGVRPGGRGGGPMMAKMHAEKPKNRGKAAKRLLSYIGKNKKYLIGLLVLMACVTAVDLLGPTFQKKAIDFLSYIVAFRFKRIARKSCAASICFGSC